MHSASPRYAAACIAVLFSASWRGGRERWEREVERVMVIGIEQVQQSAPSHNATCTPVRHRGRKHGLKKTLERHWTRD